MQSASPTLAPQPSRTFKAALLASGTLLTSLVGLGSAMVLTRVLIKTDYGTYQQTLLAYNLAAPLLAMGLPLALYYFLPRDAHRTRAALTENLILLGVLGLAFTLFIMLGGNRLLASRTGDANTELERSLFYFAPYALFMLPAMSVSAVLVSMDRYRQIAMYNWISRLVMLALAVFACLIWRTPTGAVTGQVAGAALVFVPAMLLMWRACPTGPWRPTVRGMREQFVYSFPLGLMRAFGVLRTQLDKLIVAGLFGTDTYAIYATGAVELPLVGVLSTSVTGVLLPEATRLTQDDRKSEALALWQRAAIKSAIMVFPMTVFFVAMASETMRVLFTVQYEASADPFRVYTLQLPLRIVNVATLFLSAGRGALLMWINLITVALNAGLSYALVRQLGPVGAAWGSCASLYLFLFPISLAWISRTYGPGLWTRELFGRLGLSILGSLVPAVLLWAVSRIPTNSDLLRLALAGGAYAVGVLGCYHLFGVLKVGELIRGVRAHLTVPRNRSN